MKTPTVHKGRSRSHRPSEAKLAQRERQAAWSADYRAKKRKAAAKARAAAEAAYAEAEGAAE